MPDPGYDDFVKAFDARTGQILPNPVPVQWVGSAYFPHIRAVPSEGPAESALDLGEHTNPDDVPED